MLSNGAKGGLRVHGQVLWLVWIYHKLLFYIHLGAARDARPSYGRLWSQLANLYRLRGLTRIQQLRFEVIDGTRLGSQFQPLMRLRPHTVRLDLHLLDDSAHALQALDSVVYHSSP